MAQRQREPVKDDRERVVEQLREVVERIRDGGFTERQREQIREFMNEMMRLMQQPAQRSPATAPSVTQQAPQTQSAPATRPAPRRTQQFVYDVSIHGRTYRVAMADPLPAGPAGQRRLHDLLLNNQLVRRENPNDPSSPLAVLAQVTMPGTGQTEQRFNAGVPNQRLDLFRDAYLGESYRGGRYVESAAIRIAEVPQTGPGRRI